MTQGRIVVVTGATRGLGRALAERLAALGHTVCGCGRSGEAVEALRTKFPPPHRWDVVDVENAGGVGGWAAAVREAPGIPDLVVNNAGVINRNAPLWKVGPDEFSRVMGVNVAGTANVIRAFVPALIDRWQAEGRHAGLIDYEAVQRYRDFGGIRIEDDVLINATGRRVLGPGIPKTVAEVEAALG